MGNLIEDAKKIRCLASPEVLWSIDLLRAAKGSTANYYKDEVIDKLPHLTRCKYCERINLSKWSICDGCGAPL